MFMRLGEWNEEQQQKEKHRGLSNRREYDDRQEDAAINDIRIERF